MTDEQVTRTRDDLEMMRRPHLWPLLHLNLKRPTHDLLGHDFAMLGYFETSEDNAGPVWLFVPETALSTRTFRAKNEAGTRC